MPRIQEELIELMNIIRDELREFICTSDKTWKGIAEEVGISRFTLMKFARNKHDISRRSLVRIKKYLDGAKNG